MEVQILALFIFFSLLLMSIKALHVGNETDRLALLAFKDEITADPHQIFTSWNHSAHFCFWPGITCSRRHGRVTRLVLPNLGLKGTVSPQLGNLSFLKSLEINKNGFHGSIPLELARLHRLKVLNMSYNSLQGEIPGSLSNCSRLFHLNLDRNGLVGNVPADLGSLSQLGLLGLNHNKLTGTIPPSLGNLSALESMSLEENSFDGRIPSELGQLFHLRIFSCAVNMLSGTVPPSLYNISSMIRLSLVSNQFRGRLSSNIGLTMPNLQRLHVGGNEFIGPLPTTLANASHLTHLDFTGNFFTGSVPVDLGNLKNLSLFNIVNNRLGGVRNNDLQFIDSLTNCTRMVWLGAEGNTLVGSLPKSISNLSKHLEYLILGNNQIHGAIPLGIENLVQLRILDLAINHLTGEIPATIGKLLQLVEVFLDGNKLSGKIPDDIGNLTQLTGLHIAYNQLQGQIPSSLGNYRGILRIDLFDNMLSGKIPMTLFNLFSLVELSMDNNLLTGPVPSKVGNLIFLIVFNVSNNHLSGNIPANIGSCSMLQQLFMQNNFLSGSIPPSFASVKGIEHVDLSHNNLSGNIPEFLSKLNGTNYLNLSFNNFEGEVPTTGIFSNVSAIFLDGNPKLCGGILQLHLAPCQPKFISQGRKSISMKVKFSIVASIVGTLVISCLLIICRRIQNRKHHSSSSSSIDLHFKVSYIELLKATYGFSSSNLIGVGSFGTVYKGFLQNYQAIVAIKVLNLDKDLAVKTFMDECEALRNIRHRNLVKILTSCSSSDFKGRDFKALVFELMSNGSIEQWLHQQMTGNDSLKYLGFSKRLDVAIDVANALDYLHNQCEPPIVHCDVKPSNILLDDDMVAHLGDFGLARSLVTSRDHSSCHQTSSSILKGSIGYIAPEYGVGSTVTTHGDVYSYGIVLLEMITGKKPTNEMFGENLNLPKYVKMAIPERVMEIVDPLLLLREDLREKDRLINCLVCVAKIGVVCSAEYPKERLDMKDICRELMKVRGVFHETKTIRITNN